MDETYSRLFYHVTWSTKHRLPLMSEPVEKLIRACVFLKADELGCTVHAFGATDDHIHIAIQVPPRESLSTIVAQIKGYTAFTVNARNVVRQGLDWQEGFGSFTVSEDSLPKVVAYVARQREQHQAFT